MKAVLLGGDETDFPQLQKLFEVSGWELTRLGPDAATLHRATEGEGESILQGLLPDLRAHRDTILLVDAQSDPRAASSIVRFLRRTKVQRPIAVLAPPLGD